MIQLIFILIAYAFRNKCIAGDDPIWWKLYYYGANAVITPLLAIPFFRWLNRQTPDSSDNHAGGGMIFPNICQSCPFKYTSLYVSLPKIAKIFNFMAKGHLSEDTINFIVTAESDQLQQEIHKSGKALGNLNAMTVLK